MVITKHKFLSIKAIQEIGRIKHSAWMKYSIDQHIDWMNENLPEYTTHYRWYAEWELQAYMYTVEVYVTIDGFDTNVICVGGLCAKNQGRMYGYYLIKKVVNLQYNGFIGFCGNNLIEFYKYLGWKVADVSKIDMPFIDLTQNNVITYTINFDKLIYNGKKF